MEALIGVLILYAGMILGAVMARIAIRHDKTA
jgi:hypothetical protein